MPHEVKKQTHKWVIRLKEKLLNTNLDNRLAI